MSEHSFNFDGGTELSRIGASWFVSYSYHKKIDETHTNWRNVSTWESRASIFRHSTQYHKYWLKQIINMDDLKLNTNELGLNGEPLNAEQVKQMAKELLLRG